METDRQRLEHDLDSFDATARKRALCTLQREVRSGGIQLPEQRPVTNLHAHTFFSYNAYGYSPTHYAWKARLCP